MEDDNSYYEIDGDPAINFFYENSSMFKNINYDQSNSIDQKK